MSTELKREYLQVVRKRYEVGSKREKTRILTDFCQDFGYSRKYAIRILNGTQDVLARKKPRIGGRVAKKYDLPKTPYQRLLDCADLTSEAKARLKQRHERLNPFHLKAGLEQALERFKLQQRKYLSGDLAA